MLACYYNILSHIKNTSRINKSAWSCCCTRFLDFMYRLQSHTRIIHSFWIQNGSACIQRYHRAPSLVQMKWRTVTMNSCIYDNKMFLQTLFIIFSIFFSFSFFFFSFLPNLQNFRIVPEYVPQRNRAMFSQSMDFGCYCLLMCNIIRVDYKNVTYIWCCLSQRFAMHFLAISW